MRQQSSFYPPGIDNVHDIRYNFCMLIELLAVNSDFKIKLIAGISGLVLGFILLMILIFRKKNDKD